MRRRHRAAASKPASRAGLPLYSFIASFAAGRFVQFGKHLVEAFDMILHLALMLLKGFL
jgi:hypothetical protein